MIPLLVPAVILQAEAQPFDFEKFKASRIHRESDPELMAALNRLYQDSPSFRQLLARFAKDQPNIILLLKPIEKKVYGSLGIIKLVDGYIVIVGVQTRLAKSGVDSLEPWLGFLVYGLLEISNKDGVIAQNQTSFLFNPSVEKRMWKFQLELRHELAQAGTRPKLKLNSDGEHLYRTLVLGEVNWEWSR